MKKPRPTDPTADTPYPTRTVAGNRHGSHFRYTDPAVAESIARAVFASAFDFEAGISTICPKDWTEEQIATEAHLAKKNPHVQQQMQKLYEKFGFDDESFKKFQQMLWYQASQGNDRLRVAALKMLALGFGIGEKADEGKKIRPLTIKGLEQGLKRMGITPSDDNFSKIDTGEADELPS